MEHGLLVTHRLLVLFETKNCLMSYISTNSTIACVLVIYTNISAIVHVHKRAQTANRYQSTWVTSMVIRPTVFTLRSRLRATFASVRQCRLAKSQSLRRLGLVVGRRAGWDHGTLEKVIVNHRVVPFEFFVVAHIRLKEDIVYRVLNDRLRSVAVCAQLVRHVLAVRGETILQRHEWRPRGRIGIHVRVLQGIKWLLDSATVLWQFHLPRSLRRRTSGLLFQQIAIVRLVHSQVALVVIQ